MNSEGFAKPVRWILDQLKIRRSSLVTAAGYEEIARRIDQSATADHLSLVEMDSFAKV
jgi:hypothetical protein